MLAGSAPELDSERENVRVLLAALWPVFRTPTLSEFVACVGTLLPQLRATDPSLIGDVASRMGLFEQTAGG